MLLIDGVRYEEWIPPNEDEFEQVVKEHAQDIFGEQSIYLDRKQKLKSLSGVGSIPDGYVIILGDSRQWHIVEVELSSHPLHDHIVSQVGRFISGVNNPRARTEIIGAIYGEINRDEFLKLKIKQVIGQTEIYKFLSDLISKPLVLTIIIEKDTQGLREAISTLAHPEIKVVEFATFTRERTELTVHAHLFEPVFQVSTRLSPIVEPKGEVSRTRKGLRRVTVKNLIDARKLKADQVIYGWHENKKYEGKVLNNGDIIVVPSGDVFNSPSGAASHIRCYQEDGWRWWHTTREDGKECKLDDLRSEYERNLSA